MSKRQLNSFASGMGNGVVMSNRIGGLGGGGGAGFGFGNGLASPGLMGGAGLQTGRFGGAGGLAQNSLVGINGGAGFAGRG